MRIGTKLVPTMGAALLAVVVAVGVSNSMGSAGGAGTAEGAGTPGQTATYPPAGLGHGTLLHAEPIPASDPALASTNARGWTIRYASKAAIDDHPIDVTGALIVPPGTPPPGGWRVISWAHGTTGISDRCAPSSAPGLGGQADGIAGLIKQGYAVAATDYEGLGTPGPHPYLIPRSEGRGVVDAVIAAHQIRDTELSNEWVAFGSSQGGQAVLGAGELAEKYGTGGLRLIGVVALAPAPDFSPMLTDVPNLSAIHRGLFPLLLAGLKTQHPLNETDYLGVQARDAMKRIEDTCAPTVGDFFSALPKFQVGPHTEIARQQLAALLRQESVPQGRTPVPVMIGQGMRDELVLPEWTNTTVSRACGFGDVLDYRAYPTATHVDVGRPAAADVWSYIADRFAGKPARNAC